MLFLNNSKRPYLITDNFYSQLYLHSNEYSIHHNICGLGIVSFFIITITMVIAINILCMHSLSFNIIEPINEYTVSKFCLGIEKICKTYTILTVIFTVHGW
jgi:hypothetical protein